MKLPINPLRMISPAVAFLIVSFSLGELGDGLNIFQGIYLVNIGWNEGAVGTALSMMGFTALIVQTFAGDWVSISFDRKFYLSVEGLQAIILTFLLFCQFFRQRWTRRTSTDVFFCLLLVF